MDKKLLQHLKEFSKKNIIVADDRVQKYDLLASWIMDTHAKRK